MAIALSDYLMQLRAASPKGGKAAKPASKEPDGGQATEGAQTTPNDFSPEGRAQLAQSSLPGLAFNVMSSLAGPLGTAISLGGKAAMAHNASSLQAALQNQDYETVAAIMNSVPAQDARYGELSSAQTNNPNAPYGWSSAPGRSPNFNFQGRTGIGVEEGQAPTPDPAAFGTPAYDSGGFPTGPVGGPSGPTGDTGTPGQASASEGQYHTGGMVKDRKPGTKNEPIVAQEGEFVIKRSAVQHYGKTLLQAINDTEADVKVSRKPKDLKEAMTK